MSKSRVQRTLLLLMFPLLLLSGTEYFFFGASRAPVELDSVYLLVPDDVERGNPVIHEWMDAAEEEGLHLGVLHDSELLNPLQRAHSIKGLIIPDMIHRTANA